MKNLQYFPFERNRYYYGKLLTEQDFRSEQRYMNDKRRLINRFLHGTGIAAGFQVVRLDEKSVSVEAGVALDGAGREIVADSPFVVRLEQLDGFSALAEKGSRDFVYLCIAYDETQIMPSHSITSHSSLEEEGVEYDKYREGYHLYLTDRPLENRDATLDALFWQQIVLYEDERVCISQEIPRFAASGEAFETAILLENKHGAWECSLKLEEGLTCASFEETNTFSAEIKQRMEGRGAKYRFPFTLRAFPLEMGEIVLSLDPYQVKLWVGEEKGGRLQEIQMRLPIVTKSRAEAMKEGYYRETMNQVLQNAYPPPIYLAKLFLTQTGHVYLIDRVEQVPFQQYVYPPQMMMGLLTLLEEERQKESRASGGEESSVQAEEAENGSDFAEGTVEILLGLGGKRGERFFSPEIVHGLGLGWVNISLAIESDRELLWGSSEVFEDFSPRAELAAKADMSRGSFVIGIRLLEATGMQTVRVHWTAQKKQEEDRHAQQPRLAIRPDKLELKIRETYYLQAVTQGLSGMTVLWEVKTQDGGTVSMDGMYHAPEYPGIYEVQAWCRERPEIRASLYVIVRE